MMISFSVFENYWTTTTRVLHYVYDYVYYFYHIDYDFELI